jgi:hypothetical protein
LIYLFFYFPVFTVPEKVKIVSFASSRSLRRLILLVILVKFFFAFSFCRPAICTEKANRA